MEGLTGFGSLRMANQGTSFGAKACSCSGGGDGRGETFTETAAMRDDSGSDILAFSFPLCFTTALDGVCGGGRGAFEGACVDWRIRATGDETERALDVNPAA